MMVMRWASVMRNATLSTMILLLVTLGAARGGDVTFTTYHNARFGYSVDVPQHFVKGEAPANNDGRTFTSPHDKGMIAVFGSFNALETTAARLKEEKAGEYVKEGAVLDYRAGKGHWFVLSGSRGGEIFYEKVVFSEDRETILTVLLRYPSSQKARYDPIVTRAARTLRFDAAGPR